jgi:hypothetical protein
MISTIVPFHLLQIRIIQGVEKQKNYIQFNVPNTNQTRCVMVSG